VYFGRAVALIEGIGARYVPEFNPVAFAAPVILRHRRAVIAAMGDDVSARMDLVTVFGRLAGDITNVVVAASREIVSVVALQLPAVFGRINEFFEPLPTNPPSGRVKLLPVVIADAD
jgi:hypothetical protein